MTSKQETARRYVNELIEAGSAICAIDDRHYVVCETVPPGNTVAAARINSVRNAFGTVEELRTEIIAYLLELGRFQPAAVRH